MSGTGEKNDNRPDQEEAIPTASFGAGAVGPGGQIGPYKLLNILGEGGFAVVYLAEQQRPVKRRVALKIIKPGMDTKQVIARFEAERQALALLDHPNVAHVYDAGTTDFGRPYFAMECVKGVPITEHCDRHKLTVEERLKLFLQICEAVQHAHQKGIIHRDIKPSNILVLFEGQRALPKVIDFGIAKAISQPLTERTLYTEKGQMVGTPEYMSPEQAEMTAQDIDTRSDIYSLGVLLYELLTGVLPFEAEALREGGLDHIRQVIREEEPKTPSTRLSRLTGEESTKLAQHRRTDPGVLQRRLRGDLDWITLKAMEKNRTRRYETAHALAQDIERHLKHEPVVAGPPSTVYKIKKFVRRNRASVTAAAAVAAAIVVGLVVSTALYFQAESLRVEAEQARQKEAVARTQAEQAEKTAQQQRQRAERLLARAQLERGVRLLNEGNCLGLLDLLEARMTADEIPDLRDSAARLWAIAYDLWSDRLVHVLPRADNLAFSPDGRLLASARGAAAQLWDVTTGRPHGPPLPLEKTIGAVVFSPAGKLLATHSVEGVSRLWDTTTWHPVGPILRHEGGTTKGLPDLAWWSAAFSPDGKLLATASVDGTVRLWETDTGQPYRQPLRHEGEVWAVAFSPDGKLLASGSRDEKIVRLWDVASGEPHGPLLQHDRQVDQVAFSPDGKLVATMLGGGAGLWKTDSGKLRDRLHHGGWIQDLAFSPDGKLLATASTHWTVQLWQTETGRPCGQPLRHQDGVRAVAFSPDGKLLASGSADGTVRLWEVPSGQAYGQPRHQGAQARRVVFSPDSKSLAITGWRGTTRIWRTYQQLRTEVMPRQSGAELGAVSPDGKVGAIVLGDMVQLWDTTTVKALGEPLRHDGQVSTAVFSPDGKLLATGLSEAIQLWDVTTGQPIGQPFEPTLKTQWELALAFSPDGKLLAKGEGGSSWKARVFEVATRQCLHTLDCQANVDGVAFSPDGKVLATGSNDGMARLWDVVTGEQLASPLRHEARVWAAAYSPDGNVLATVSGEEDKTLRLWDVSTGLPYHSLALPAGAISGKAALSSFSSDGTVLVRRLADGTARVWRVPAAPADLREMQVRTWVALGAQRNEQGEAKAIPHQQWQKLREEVRAFEVRGPQASRPRPANGGDLSVGPDAKLTWIPGLDAVAHNVYLGSSPSKLKFLGKVKNSIYANLPPLERHRWYCWRVDTVKADGSVIKGDLWSFSAGKIVGWWKFDEGHGSTALDWSGHGNHGTLQGDPKWVAGIIGGALDLDGSDFVTIDGVVDDITSNNITVSAWVKTTQEGEGEVFASNDSAGSHPFMLGLQGGNVYVSDEYIDEGLTPIAVNDGQWHMWTYVRRGPRGYIYVDAVQESTHSADFDLGSITRWSIGQEWDNATPSNFYVGTVDDARIYSYALSQAEVAAIHAGEGPSPIAKPKWVVDVSGEEYVPPEPEPEKGDEYYVPLRSELEQEEAEQTLIETQEALEIKRRVLGEEHRSTLLLMNNLAWLQATSPKAELRDGLKAIEYASPASRDNVLKLLRPMVSAEDPDRAAPVYACPSLKPNPNPAYAPTRTSRTGYLANAVLLGRKAASIPTPGQLIVMQEGWSLSNHLWVQPEPITRSEAALQGREPTQYREWHMFASRSDHSSWFTVERREQTANVHKDGGNFIFADGRTEYRKYWERKSGDYGIIHPKLKQSVPYEATMENGYMSLDPAF